MLSAEFGNLSDSQTFTRIQQITANAVIRMQLLMSFFFFPFRRLGKQINLSLPPRYLFEHEAMSVKVVAISRCCPQ